MILFMLQLPEEGNPEGSKVLVLQTGFSCLILVLLFESLLWRTPGWASAGQSRGASPNTPVNPERATGAAVAELGWRTDSGTRECCAYGEGIPQETPKEVFVCVHKKRMRSQLGW